MISSIFALKGPITRSIFAYLWTPSIWKASIWEAFMDVQMKGSRHAIFYLLWKRAWRFNIGMCNFT